MRWWVFGAVVVLSSCGGSTVGSSGEADGSGGTRRGGGPGAGGQAPPGGSTAAGGASAGGASAGGANTAGTGGAPPPGSGGIGPFFDAGFGPCEGVTLSPPYGSDFAVNAYMLIDASAAMSEASASGKTWWEEMANAVVGYATDRRTQSASNALQFYPDAASDAGACADNYDVPAVPPSLLSESAGRLATAFEDRVPGGENLPGEAMSTGHDQIRAYLSGNFFDRAALVLVTRTTPGECLDKSLAGLAHAATESFKPVRTHVLVLGDGADRSSLDLIAKAGGSESARVLPGKNLQREFSDAMARVRYPDLGCTYDLPEYYLARRGVTVYATPSGATSVLVPFVDTLEECQADADGALYDGEAVPPKITLCPETCTLYAGASFSATLACSRGRHE